MKNDVLLEKLREKMLPMSETMLYILFALKEERHGYGIMLYIKERTKGAVELGAGTLYQTLSKLEKASLIAHTYEQNRKKFYKITELGLVLLKEEAERIKNMYNILEVLL